MSYDRVWYSSYRLKIALYLKAPYSRCFCGQKFSVIIKITVFKWTKWAHLIKYTHSVNLPHVYQRIVTSSLTAFYKIFFFFLPIGASNCWLRISNNQLIVSMSPIPNYASCSFTSYKLWISSSVFQYFIFVIFGFAHFFQIAIICLLLWKTSVFANFLRDRASSSPIVSHFHFGLNSNNNVLGSSACWCFLSVSKPEMSHGVSISCQQIL